LTSRLQSLRSPITTPPATYTKFHSQRSLQDICSQAFSNDSQDEDNAKLLAARDSVNHYNGALDLRSVDTELNRHDRRTNQTEREVEHEIIRPHFADHLLHHPGDGKTSVEGADFEVHLPARNHTLSVCSGSSGCDSGLVCSYCATPAGDAGGSLVCVSTQTSSLETGELDCRLHNWNEKELLSSLGADGLFNPAERETGGQMSMVSF